MADNGKVTAQQGKLFKVVLGSNFGSTNIGWCLTSLPQGIALLAEEVIPLSSQLGTQVQQVFYFSVLNEIKNAKLEFRLIEHLAVIGKKEQRETVEIEVEVVSGDLKSDVSKRRFVEYNGNAAAYFPPVQDDDCTQVLKYGYPPYMKYGYPAVSAGGEVPCPPVTEADGTIVYKYGYPPLVKYGYFGAPVKYGYPPEGAKTSCEVVQDDCGCYVVKYGYPRRIMYGYPDAPVKYGYPCCQD
jgi:hypothetical protein